MNFQQAGRCPADLLKLKHESSSPNGYREREFEVARLPDKQTARLPDYQKARLPDYQTARLPDRKKTMRKDARFCGSL